MLLKNIKITTEYITLGQLLKFTGTIQNGSDAKAFLESQVVLVNGEKESRRGRKLYKNYEIIILNQKFILVN